MAPPEGAVSGPALRAEPLGPLAQSMRARADFFLEGLLSLDRYERADRRAVFRQSVASLALAAPGQTPLEGCDEAAIGRSVHVALADGLFEDLGWLAAPAAGVALYEIAGALPLGAERRELGRRVLEELYEGDAATFVAIATRMAVGGAARALSGAGIRARVALALSLPASAGVPVDPLALALVSRRELCTSWLGAHAVGSLPERRLAARLLERAAREAAERAHHGDDEPALLFHGVVRAADRSAERSSDGRPRPDTIEGAWRTLLDDRETLVWRHVASARGLLSRAVPALGDEIKSALATRLSPTEWRRAATSLAAGVAVDPEASLARSLDILKSPLLERDPGIAAALLWGLGRAADTEPEAAGALLDALSHAAPLFIAEDLIELRAETGGFGDAAAARCAAALTAAFPSQPGEEDVFALSQRLRQDLVEERLHGEAGEGVTRADQLLRPALERAVDAFVESGSREAYARARIALARASETVDMLDALHVDPNGVPESTRSRSAAVVLVRQLDVLLLESGVLQSLLVLSRGPGETGGSFPDKDELDERLGRWLLRSESVPFAGGASAGAGAMAHQRKLRALLHLIDADTTELEDDQARRHRVQDRWTSTCRLLFTRLAEERATPLRRAVAATVARSLDALVRDGAADPADALLYAAYRTKGPEDLGVLAEASMSPDVRRLLTAYARFVETELGRPEGTVDTSARIASLDGLVLDLPVGGSQRLEALRSAITRLGRALGAVQAATALRPLADPESSPLASLADALDRLGQLTAAALRRSGGEDEPIAVLPSPAYPLAAAVARALQAGRGGSGARPDGSVAAALQPVLSVSLERAFASLPRALAGVVARILPRIATLPVDVPGHASSQDDWLRQSDPGATPSGGRVSEGPLPAWVPSRRTLGGFYVHRQIGVGAAGTVFVVTRADERHDPHAERFALKVPDYDATAARSLSEADFLKLFRDEAGALLAIPEHENLARFVTFDAGARPKPILVMELIEGARCDKLLASRLVTMDRCFALLDGVLAGLGAMHGVGVGHLDIKPSNVILRGGVSPVLVDFGLAGRHLRPGCGTSSYGAPEVWGIVPEGVRATPMAADVYGFGCLAYEVLTGETLFDAPNEVALISAHLTHDGVPPPVKRLLDRGVTAGVAGVLRRCLRKSPANRATVPEIRAELKKAGQEIGGRSWPVPV
jgi:hypothetical protein